MKHLSPIRRTRGLGSIVRRRLRMRVRRQYRIAPVWPTVTRCTIGIVVCTGLLLALAYLVGKSPTTSSKLVNALAATIAKPPVAIVVGALLVVVIAACLRRVWFDRLARLPGSILVRDLATPSALAGVDVPQLSMKFRERLQQLRMQAPAPVPGATPAQSFLDMLDAEHLNTSNPLGSAVSILRAAVPTHCYEVSPTLLVDGTSAPQCRYGVTVQLTRLPREAIPVSTVWASTCEDAVVKAADVVTAAILPRTRLSHRAPWSGWRRYEMPPLLVHYFERGGELSGPEERRYEEALDNYFSALKLDPKSVDIRLQQAFVQEKLGLSLDALATYAAARLVAKETSRELYRRRTRRSRNVSGEIACYRLAVLLAGTAVAHQWRKPPGGSRRGEQLAQVRERLMPELLRLLEHYRLLGRGGGGSSDLGSPPRWSAVAVERLLSLQENDDKAREFFELRNVFNCLAMNVLRRMRPKVRRPWAPASWLSPLAIALTMSWIDVRQGWIRHKLGRSRSDDRVPWPPTVARLRALVPEYGFRTWTERFNAACLFALPLLVRSEPLHPDENEDKRMKRDLAGEAVHYLEQAMSNATSAYVASRRDWVLSEDPDLVGLRETDEFKHFETIYFPSAAKTRKRPARVHVWQRSRYTNDLLVETARRWERVWHARRDSAARGHDPHEMLEWCKTETEAWTLVHTVTREHRHWRSRHELIDRMAEWAVVYGFQPLEVRVPRFQQEASQKEVDAEIADNDDRLLLISEELERMSEPQPQLVLLRTELRDRDFWHRPTPWLYMPYVCDVHAALWQRLHEWLDEPASENHTASQAAFREALAQAHNLSTTSLGRWRIEVMHRRFHVFGGRNGRGDAGEEVAARNGHGPRGQVPVR